MLSDIPTLDKRWLAYVERTRPVFELYPQLVPIRQSIFKELIGQSRPVTWKDRVRHWSKLVRPKVTTCLQNARPVDVVFLLSHPRDVLVEAVLPVITGVEASGARIALIVSSSVARQLHLRFTPIVLSVPYNDLPVEAWRMTWDALRILLGTDLPETSQFGFMRQVSFSTSVSTEIRRLLGQLRPRVLVVPVDQFLPYSAACCVAREMGIPSVVLQHGAVNPFNTPITADYMAVWGEIARQQLEELGVPAERLVIIGSPRHDSWPQVMSEEGKARVRQKLGLGYRPLMIFFSNGNDLQRNSREAVSGCAHWLQLAAQELGDQMDFLVKLHPNEDGLVYAGMSELCVFKCEIDLATALAAADVIGALCSTVLLDALLYHKPVLQFYSDGWPDLADNWRRGLAVRIADARGLIDWLSAGPASWQDGAAIQRDRLPQVFAYHGQATSATTQMILRFVYS